MPKKNRTSAKPITGKNTSANTNRSLKKLKRLEDFQQTWPEQLSFFEMAQPEEQKYSNTIELYDFIPKYHWGKSQRIGGQFLPSLERIFECRGVRYKVRINPARIEDTDGVVRDYYPSKREELVEDALRKLACEGHGLFLDDEAGVTFSLYQLQQELRSMGHTYSISQLKDALMVCAQSNISLSTEDGDAIFVSSLFETLGLQTREDWLGQGHKTRAFVRFNSLVTQSIKRKTYRPLNYEKSMSYKSVIARQLHKRMSHHYTQASVSNPYHILLTTIVRDFGLTAYSQLRDNLRDVRNALDEMCEKDVLLEYKIERTTDTNQRNKLIEAKFILLPHPNFISEVAWANRKQIERQQLPASGRF
jgi:hypothetical protein